MTKGFERAFDNGLWARNQELEAEFALKHRFFKTGTSICACVFKDGVVLGADSRASAGNIVSDKYIMKITKLSPRIYAGGAGTAADCTRLKAAIAAQLRLYELNTGLVGRADQAAHLAVSKLFKAGGFQAYLTIGGMSGDNPEVWTTSGDGTVRSAPWAVEGSGTYAQLSVFEQKWHPELTEEEAMALVADSIEAGITNDLGSGSVVNLVVVRRDGAEEFPNYRIVNQRPLQPPLQDKVPLPVEILTEVRVPLARPIRVDGDL